MMYFKCLINVILNNSLKTILIVSLAVLCSSFLTHRDQGMRMLGLSLSDKSPKVSFVTSIEDSYQDLKNKIVVLPGVEKVTHQDSHSIKEKISFLFKSAVLRDVISKGPGYSKFTIHFKPNVTSKSINLIKSYIIKTLSGTEVFFGKVQGLNKNKSIKKIYVFYFLYGLCILFLLGIYTAFELNLKKLTYLFQRFQRRGGLTYKVSFLSFFTLVLFPTLITLFIFEGFVFKNILTFLIPSGMFFFLINLKKFKWLG